MDRPGTESRDPKPPANVSSQKTFLVVFSVASGFVMAMLDVTVVNVALGDIQQQLGVPLSGLVWIIDGYTLAYAALLLVGGCVADRFGSKHAYLMGLMWFVAASALCGIAWNSVSLVSARLLQGAGAALFVPSSLGLLAETFPDRSMRASLLGLWGALIAAAATAGPLVGGVLVSQLGWRSIFFLNVPIGTLGFLCAAAVLNPSPRTRRNFDIPTHLSLVIAVGCLSFFLIQGPAIGWASPPVVVSVLLTLGGFVCFAIREARGADPIVPRDLVSNRRFLVYNALGFSVNFVLFGEIFAVSLLLPHAFGKSALATGLNMLPMMCMLSIMNLISARVSMRYGSTNAIRLGFSAAIVGTTAAAALGCTFGWVFLAVALVGCNAGIGLAMPAVMNGLMHEVGVQHANSGAATLNANRQMGALAGVAVVGTILHEVPDWSVSVRLAFSGFTLCGALCLWAIWSGLSPGTE